MNHHYSIDEAAAWTILPPGDRAILRFPFRGSAIPEGCQLAGFADLVCANHGFTFPWGDYPDSSRASVLWRKYMIGMGGLFHDTWYVTKDGRVGGAANVPQELPGALRFSMYLDGGKEADPVAMPRDNEGFALVKPTSRADAIFYRLVQLHAMEHVGADGGRILVSPLENGNQGFVGFTGRCLSCPNIENISLRQLQSTVPDFSIQLYPEWKNWLPKFALVDAYMDGARA